MLFGGPCVYGSRLFVVEWTPRWKQVSTDTVHQSTPFWITPRKTMNTSTFLKIKKQLQVLALKRWTLLAWGRCTSTFVMTQLLFLGSFITLIIIHLGQKQKKTNECNIMISLGLSRLQVGAHLGCYDFNILLVIKCFSSLTLRPFLFVLFILERLRVHYLLISIIWLLPNS